MTGNILTSSSDNDPFFSSILAANLLTSPTMFLAYGNKKTMFFMHYNTAYNVHNVHNKEREITFPLITCLVDIDIHATE